MEIVNGKNLCCRLKEENTSLRLEIMKIQLEDKKYRDLQQEVDQLSAQLRKVRVMNMNMLRGMMMIR
jgi:hypothetical protein